MAYSIFYFDEVETDLKEAKLWYSIINKELELRFITAIEKTVFKLQEWLKAYAIRYKNIRVTHSPVFPYAIHFYVDDDKEMIVIIAILHGRRHPDYVKKRLP